jgi:hypothetical protein
VVNAACLVAGNPAAAIARWRSPGRARPAGSRLAVAGDLMAANADTAAEGVLEVADVIWSGRCQPPLWLDRYPGCAVAAAPAPGGGYLVAARGQQDKRGLRVRVAGDPGSGALLCATFMHAWLAAGWPPDAMDPACLEAVMPWAATTAPSVSVPFVLSYKGSFSRRWMSSASGAPMPE